ncbi:Pkinase-domain-containing protein [Teratosphaeria nubilosa]|uniref:Pkinase-domain-containing protein n=1 Tax=Teratosphaeria nubilosa TaxID=161662 RepID=A0A6G1L2W7_9PEZI|nr:Pkinase-domain-containing protein [Teratosphaeria nubilosa]
MSSVHADPPPPIVTEPSGIHYATGAALGKGGFAICHRAERYDGNKPTGHMVALKIVKTKMEPAKLAQKFVTELQIHSKLSHPNIVTFYRAFSFQTSTYVVLELCPNGSLADMLKKRKHLTLPEIRRFVIQICGAVKYLHHRHIVHRDLKTGNLFLDQNMNVKVGDFGLAALLVTEREMEVKRRTTMCGTPNYLAPEILEKGKGHDEKVDLWAIGVIAYTLAVGKAPFHASTKEEIYKKLKSGTYNWPELSTTTNQSADLRDLVASLLVPEEQRPPPDQIVSQNFFKIAFVPSSIPVTARERAPTWPENTVPSAETIRRGFSETWWTICRQSGVGEYDSTEQKCFRLNGGKRIKSIVYDMMAEEQLGKSPTMPIPRDTVYISTVSNWDAPAASDEENSAAAARRPVSGNRGLKEISHNEVASTRLNTAVRRTVKEERDAEMMPPPSMPASRAIGRSTVTVRRAARTISEEKAEAVTAATKNMMNIAADELAPTLNVSKTRAAPASLGPVAALKEMMNSTSSCSRSGPSQRTSGDSDVENPFKSSYTAKRSADASLARRPRAPSRTTARKVERSISPEVPGPLATLDELKKVSPFKQSGRSRKKQTEAEPIEILSDAEPEDAARAPAPATLSFPPPPVMSKRLPKPIRQTSSPRDINGVPDTDPSTVLSRLSLFRDNLASALANTTPPSSAPAQEAERLPFVSRWVDYSRKHGVGYVMSDGTVGCIINSSAAKPNKPESPVTHVFVRNGQHFLKRVGKNFENLDSIPFEILEDGGKDGIRRKVYKGLGSVKEGPLAFEAERRRTLGVLWVKFGRYMCQSLDGSEEVDVSSKGEGNFVRFYQRIGNVGIWAFSDGSLQVHFPDHTKTVLSPTAHTASLTLLLTSATSYLATHDSLLPHHVCSRELHTDSLSALLHDGGRMRLRTVHANAVGEKMAFVLKVVQQWVRNGGLGRLDGDEDCAGFEGTRENLEWEGVVVREGAGGVGKKVDRVTVGRCGGDEVVRVAA